MLLRNLSYLKNLLFFVLFTHLTAHAMPADTIVPDKQKPEDFYRIGNIPLPNGVVLEVGGMEMLPNGKLAVSTRHGEVWLIENPAMPGFSIPKFKKFAEGMHEVLGLTYRDGYIYVVQRGELTRLKDTDNDGEADVYEAVYTLPVTGHYHEYAFGPVVKENGDMYVTLNVSFNNSRWWEAESNINWRGWTIKISPNGEMTPVAAGMRSPAGVGLIDNEFFYTENQGDWVGSGWPMHVEKGNFIGNPAGLNWSRKPESPVKIRRDQIVSSDAPMFETAQKLPGFKMPAVWFPHTIMGISTSGIIVNNHNQFGPHYADQVFVGDQGHSKIMRVALEKVNGQYQGVCFPFIEGFSSGVLRMTWGHDGTMYVGMTNRGWASTGKEPYGVQKLNWTGKTPFDIKTITAKPDGFEIVFTKPVNKTSASNTASYAVSGFTYKYHKVYGSPVINQKNHAILGAVVSEDGMSVRIKVDSLRQYYIHEIKAEGIRATDGLTLLNNTGYYTLNNIPQGDLLVLPTTTPAYHEHHHTSSMSPAGIVKSSMPKENIKNPVKPVKKQVSKGTHPESTFIKNVTTMPAEWNGFPDQTINIETEPGLQYDPKIVEVKAGSKIKFTLTNNDDMLHNLVIVEPGTAIEIGNMALALGLKGQKMNYVPHSDKVLFHTKILLPEAEETIYFTAPSTPGDYTYVCTFPGHFYLMQGTLKVVK